MEWPLTVGVNLSSFSLFLFFSLLAIDFHLSGFQQSTVWPNMNRGWLCLFSFSAAKKEGKDLFSRSLGFLVVAGSGCLARFISFFPFTFFFPSHLVKSNYIGIFFRPRPNPYFFFVNFFSLSFRYLRHSFFYTNVIALCEWPDPWHQSTDQSENLIQIEMNESG